jgi:hypothetical protein
MQISRGFKILIGIGTLLVAAYPLLFIAFAFVPIFMAAMADSQGLDPGFAAVFFLIFPLMFLIMFAQLGLMIFYIVHIVKNREGSEVLRILCGLGVYFLPFVAMPVYFFVYIWPEDVADWALEKA